MESPHGEKLFQQLGYRFHDSSLFRRSLTHKSYVNEHPGRDGEHNERLEFLGDAVLDFVITDLLMDRFPTLSEGELSKTRASLVSETGLAKLARELDLGEYLLMGRGEGLSGGRQKSSILADAMEALIAAIYLDSREKEGSGGIFTVIANLFRERIAKLETKQQVFDFKTELQEVVHKRLKEPVQYKVIHEEGPDHDKLYEVAVFIREREWGRGKGRSKKESEQEAARIALEGFSTP